MWSYDRHTSQEQELSGTNDLPACFERPKSIDSWQHQRMFDMLLPLTKSSPGSSWMTIGDGKFGSDAYYLQAQGVEVTATSISTHTLQVAHSKGYIKKYAAENAEALSLADHSVDFVLCKESYHHFPRPPIAFYEMLRVSRKALVLIEPIEGPARPLSVAKSYAKRLLRGDATEQFEVSGNYLYRVTIREIFKMLTAIGYGSLAWKGFNTFYHPRFTHADANALSVASVVTRAGIATQNFLSQLSLLNYGLATIICFKEEPSQALLDQLSNSGFSIIPALVNPYV